MKLTGASGSMPTPAPPFFNPQGIRTTSHEEAFFSTLLKAFGERIAARDPDRQTAEIQSRIALMNRFSALGTADIVRVA